MVRGVGNKKGQIVTAFLVKLILAILLLFAVSALVGNIFSILLNQSGENFVDFVSELKFVGEQDPGYKLNSLVILDEQSAVVYFEGEEDVELTLKYYNYRPDETAVFNKPNSCSEERGCICLFKAITFDNDKEGQIYESSISSITCREVEEKINLTTSCSLGVLGKQNLAHISHECTNGFVIERNNFVSDEGKGYLYNERRIALTLESTDEGVTITPHIVYDEELENYEELSDYDIAGGEGSDYLP